MSNKKVSIITSTYNLLSNGRKGFFYECFRSIHEQDYPYIEHVIVDGKSNDGSVEYIKSIINRYAKKEVVFISEKDNGINDATNKGVAKSSGDYVILMCDDDFYTRKYSISKLVKAIENNNADFSCASGWWLNKKVWSAKINSFAYRHPFLINAFLIKKELLKGEIYLDPKFPLVGDYDLFMRLLKKDGVKGAEVNDVLTVLRPGGYSQSDDEQYINEITTIIANNMEVKNLFSKEELWSLHCFNPTYFTLLKLYLFCKNRKIRESLFSVYDKRFLRKNFARKCEYIIFFKFITKYFKKKKSKPKIKPDYTFAKSIEWIETFYRDIY